MYSLTIDLTGTVSDVDIHKSSSQTSGYSYDSRFLEIENVITRMPKCAPATADGRNSTLKIYLPLKLRLEQNSVIMYSAKNSIVFKNRE